MQQETCCRKHSTRNMEHETRSSEKVTRKM
jgi:hypothetical protein